VYAGAYVYGKTRNERYVDEQGTVRKRIRHLPQEEWLVFLPGHHEGFIDWATFEAIQVRLQANIPARLHQAGHALREGSALLQGLAICGHCGRRLRIAYQGTDSTPRYYCKGEELNAGHRGECLNVGGLTIDQAVTNIFLEALTPAALEATALAVEQLESHHDAALSQWRLEVERARYEAERAERQYKAVEPENRLVARGLEKEWETRLQKLASAEAELHRREQQRPRTLTVEERQRVNTLGADLRLVWTAPTTSDRDRKELLRTLLEEVILNVERKEKESHADLTLRWRGGALSEIDLDLLRRRAAPVRTDEDTVALVRRLAIHYPDAVIAGILNRQQRTTAYGHRFTAGRVGSLRRHWGIPCFEPTACAPEGELLTIKKAAGVLGVAPSTIHRLLNDGIIAGEQPTPGAPWRIRLTKDLKDRFNGDAGEDFLPMREAMRALGVSRQTVLQRVKRGELAAVHVMRGKQKGLRIKVIGQQPDLFNPIS